MVDLRDRPGIDRTHVRAEYFAAQSTQADVTHRIVLRFLSVIIPKMRVKFGSRVFDILSIINVNERNRELQLMCRESVD